MKMNEETTVSQEEVIAELTGFCLLLYARTKAILDLIEELHGPVAAQRLKELAAIRKERLPEDLEGDGWGDSKLILSVIRALRDQHNTKGDDAGS